MCNHETAEPGACDYTIFPDYKVLPVGLLWNALPIWTMPSFPAFLAGGCVGMVIGAALGFKSHRKVVRMAEEVLSQIEELRGGG